MADPYLDSANTSGSTTDPYLNTSSGGGKAFKVTKKGRGNLIDRSWDNVKTIATKSVPGLADFVIDTSRAIGRDIANTSFNPLDSGKDPLGLHSETLKVVGPFAKNTVVSTKESFRHPLRDPVYTALNAFGASSVLRSGVVRAGEAAAQAGAVEGGLAKAAAGAKGYARGPLPGTRTATAGGVSVELPNSTNALTRDIQKLLNGVRNNNPEVRGIGAVKNQYGIVNKQVAKQIRLDHALSHVPAAQVAVEGKYASPVTRLWTNDPKGMTLTKDHAIRVVVEGVPIDERIALAQKELRAAPSNPALANGATLKSLTDPLVGEIALLNDVRRYVDTVDGKPVFKPQYQEQLGSLTAGMKGLADTRDATLIEAGVLNPEAVAAGTRANMPGRVVRGAEYVEPTPGKLGMETPGLKSARAEVRAKQRLVDLAEAQVAKQKFTSADLKKIGAVAVDPDREIRLQSELDAINKTIQDSRPKPPKVGDEVTALREQRVLHKRLLRFATGLERLAAEYGDEAKNLGVQVKHGDLGPLEIQAKIEELTFMIHALGGKIPMVRFPELEAAAKALRAELKKVRENPLSVQSGHRIITGSGEIIEPLGSANHRRVSAALSVAKERLAQAEAAAANRVTQTGLVGAEDFTGGSFRVPYQRKPGSRALFGLGSMGSKGVVAFPAKPGSLTHSFTGDMLKSGWYRKDTTRLMVETAVEAERFAGLLRDRERFIQAGVPLRRVRHGRDGRPLLDKNGQTISNDIPIRMDALKNMPFHEGVKAIIGKYENGQVLNADETAIFGRAYDTIRDAVFPKVGTIAEDVPVEGVLWVDKRILGHLDEVNPVFGVKADKALAFTDAVNNAERFAILYLKPAYAVPNVMGNAFLTLTQQGVFAPQNLARSIRLDHRIGVKNRVFVDEAMGDGISHAISTQVGAGKNVINFAASKWGNIVDVPFRRSAFLHEAGKLGFKTEDDFTRLFKSPENRQVLQEITDRATTALIDYSDLTPFERNYIRRLVFFYPWVKGSTKYAGKYLQDHPVQAMVQEQLGEKGKRDILASLGELPSFMDGVFKVYERNGMPMVINPAAASIFGTPAQVVGTLKYLAAGNFKTAELPKNFSVPLLDAVIAAATGTDPFTGNAYPSDTSGGQIMFDQLTGGLPQLVLGRRLTGDQSGKLYPMNRMDSLLSFVLGVAPKPLDVGVAHGMAARGK